MAYSDPFGLCPEHNLNCELLRVAAQITGGILGGIGGFAMGAAAGVGSGPGAVATSIAGAVSFGVTTAAASGKLVDMSFAMSNGGGGDEPGGGAGSSAGGRGRPPTAQESRAWLSETNRANGGLNRLLIKWFKGGGDPSSLPEQISREYLEHYRNAAQDAIRRGIDNLGVQTERVEMLNRILN